MRRILPIHASLLALFLVVRGTSAQSPAQFDFSTEDRLLSDAVADHQIPGAVLIVGHDGKVVYRQCYGSRSLEPVHEAMTLDTIFDMASLTKPLITATAVGYPPAP